MMFIKCSIIEQPLKIPFVSAIVRHVNLYKPELVGRILEKASVRAQAFMQLGDWRSVKLLLRFFACLQDVFGDDGVFGVLDELFNRAVDLQAASPEDVWPPLRHFYSPLLTWY